MKDKFQRARPRFKIDGIVWKYLEVYVSWEEVSCFKIDGIVWKWVYILFVMSCHLRL